MDISYTIEEIDKRLPYFDQLQNDITQIVIDSWSNDRFHKIASYDTTESDPDSYLFTLKELASSPDILNINDVVGPNSDDKKTLMDMVTEFNTVNFFQTKETRTNFIYLVNTSLQTMTNTMQHLMPEYPNSIDVMFKGGTTMRILIKELVRNFTVEVENYINEMLKESIKLSDFDFEIVTRNIIPEHIIFKINIITYICILRIRNYLEYNSLIFFDFFKFTEPVQKQKILELKAKIQKHINKQGSDSYFHGCKIDHIIYSGSCTESLPGLHGYRYITGMDQEEVSSCRADSGFVIDRSYKTDGRWVISGTKLLEKYGSRYSGLANSARRRGSRLYATHNPEVGWSEDDAIDGGTIHRFALNRIKHNMTLFLTTRKGEQIMMDIPGEILDLSHSHLNDVKKSKYKAEISKLDFLQRFQFMNNNLTYLSYSLKGHLSDISHILFIEHNLMPWNDKKYHKRIRRLIIIAVLLYFNKPDKSYTGKLAKIVDIIKFLMSPSGNPTSIDDDNLHKLIRYIVESLRKGYRIAPIASRNFHLTCISEFEKLYIAFKAQWDLTRDQIIGYANTKTGVTGLLDTPLDMDNPNLY